MKATYKSRADRTPNFSRTMERGANFVVVRAPIWREGNLKRWHALFTIQAEDGGGLKVSRLGLIDEYFDDCQSFSDQVRRETCQVVGLFGDYARAALTFWPEDRLRAGGLPKRLFRGFALALAKGTVDYVDGIPVDVMQLFWRPRGNRRAFRLLGRLMHMMRWLEPEIGNSVWRQFTVLRSNAKDVHSAFDLAISAGFKRKNSLLAHFVGFHAELSRYFHREVSHL